MVEGKGIREVSREFGSDGCFVKAYPAETAEAFLDGHVSVFDFLGGVPQSILYDNTSRQFFVVDHPWRLMPHLSILTQTRTTPNRPATTAPGL